VKNRTDGRILFDNPFPPRGNGRFPAGSRCILSMLAAVAASSLIGCGGGGTAQPAGFSNSSTGSGGGSLSVGAGGVVPPTAPASSGTGTGVETIVPSASVENFCATPRPGVDPFTNQPYPDKPGSVAQEKSWVRSYIDETYLWFDEVPASLRAASYPTARAFFDVLRTSATTNTGKPKDRFHFYYDTAFWDQLSNLGAAPGYGFEAAILKSAPPRDIRIAYTEPGTPATNVSIRRGDRVLEVDGVDAVNGNAVDALNAGLFPSASGQTHTLKLQDTAGNVRTVSLVSQVITSTPVQNVQVLDTPSGKTGYLLFNEHIRTSESQLVAAMNQFKAAGVTNLVLDVRYNGGGLLAIASELAYMVATPAATSGTVFERLEFNRKNPFNLTAAQTATPFYSAAQGFSVTQGQALPQLGLSRVSLLTGPGTCSASESIINGLRGVDVQVDVIGEQTCGKPYGFLPTDNCGTTYFAIQFKGVNNKGAGDYADGIAPTCQVADDFSKELGDATERRLSAALSYRATGVCPAPSATAGKPSGTMMSKGIDAADGLSVVKPGGMNMKILERSRRP
jgi:carboxyl-terminal processing protease